MLAYFPMAYLLLTLVIISHYFPIFKSTLTDNCKDWCKRSHLWRAENICGSQHSSSLCLWVRKTKRLVLQAEAPRDGRWVGRRVFLYFTHNCSENCSAVIPGSKLYPPIHADIRVNRTVLDCWIFCMKKIDLFLFCIYKIAGFFLLEF